MTTLDTNLPTLSLEAAARLVLKDRTADTPFTWRDFQENFPAELQETEPIQRAYINLLLSAEDGVITDFAAQRALFKITHSDEHRLKLWSSTLVKTAGSFVQNLPAAIATMISHSANEAYSKTKEMIPSPVVALSQTFIVAKDLAEQTAQGFVDTVRGGIDAYRSDDPELKAAAFFNSTALAGSLCMLGKIPVPGMNPVPTIASVSLQGTATATAGFGISGVFVAARGFESGIAIAATQNAGAGSTRPQASLEALDAEVDRVIRKDFLGEFVENEAAVRSITRRRIRERLAKGDTVTIRGVRTLVHEAATIQEMLNHILHRNKWRLSPGELSIIRDKVNLMIDEVQRSFGRTITETEVRSFADRAVATLRDAADRSTIHAKAKAILEKQGIPAENFEAFVEAGGKKNTSSLERFRSIIEQDIHPGDVVAVGKQRAKVLAVLQNGSLLLDKEFFIAGQRIALIEELLDIQALTRL